MRDRKYEKKTGGSGRRGALIAAIVLMAGLILSPALSKVTRADDDKACSVTVLPGFEDDDVKQANIVIDFYKIAEMEKDPSFDTYNFKVDGEGTFKEVKDYLENMPELDSTRYQMVANTAAKAALDSGLEPDETGDVEEKTTLGAGLYLMVPHGKGMTPDEYRKSAEDDPDKVITIANSLYYQYSYLPQLVALPNTAETILPDQEIKTSDGEWKDDITVTLKGEREKRFGWFKLTKKVLTFEGRQPATFVFSVKAELNNTKYYDNVVSIVFSPEKGAGKQTLIFMPEEYREKVELKPDEQAVTANIPVDATVTIKEIDAGANYKLVSDETLTTTVVSLDEKPDPVVFTNDYTEKDNGSGSILNIYDLQEDGSDPDGPTQTVYDDPADDPKNKTE